MVNKSDNFIFDENLKTATIESILSGIIIINSETRKIVYLNTSAADMIGLPREKILGRICHDFICPRQLGQCPICDCHEKVDHSEKVLIDKDGREVPILKTAVEMDIGGQRFVVENFMDITAQKKTREIESSLRDSEERHRAIFDFSRDAIMILDPDKGFLDGNPTSIELFGCKDVEEFCAQSPQTISPEFQPDGQRSDEKSHEMMRIALEKGSNFFNWQHKKIDGVEFPATVHLSRMELKGEVVLQALVRDITARKKAELAIQETKDELEKQAWGLKKTNESLRVLSKELETKNEELKRLDEMKSDFISTVSHELRTPLAIIRQGVSLLKRKILGEVSEKQEETLGDVLENVDRLVKIINDLLDISKLEAGKVELCKEKVNILEVIKKLVKEFEIKTGPKNISLKENLPESLREVDADKDRIIQVLINLLGNSVKFTPEGGSITVSAKDSGEFVEVSVTDTGPGIAKENISKLFNKFQQFGRKSGPGEKGTGLGLAIIKQIVDLHGGMIQVTSELGKGSTFTFSIPKHETAEVVCMKSINENLSDELALIIFKIEDMNKIRHTYGEFVLNEFIASISEIINNAMSRPGDRVFDHREGQLLILLPDTDIKGAVYVCERIRDAIEEKKLSDKEDPINYKYKFAAVSSEKDGKNAQELVKSAEDKLSKKKKVLIIDDHPQIVRLLKYRVENEGRFVCIAAYDGAEGFQMACKEKPDLVICDIMMPEISGYEVIGQLKENRQTCDIPIILLTSFDVEPEKLRTLGPGSIPVVTKTDGFDRLMHILNRII